MVFRAEVLETPKVVVVWKSPSVSWKYCGDRIAVGMPPYFWCKRCKWCSRMMRSKIVFRSYVVWRGVVCWKAVERLKGGIEQTILRKSAASSPAWSVSW